MGRSLESVTHFESLDAGADALVSTLLPGLLVDLIRACYAAAPSNEITSGKFARPGVVGRSGREHL